VAVREPVIAELLWPDDLYVDTARANVLHRVGDESPRRVAGIAGVRGREYPDTHQLSTRNTA
jgi:hypothetical protein